MFISIWNKKTKKYLNLKAVEHIYNDSLMIVGNTTKSAFAIETKHKKTYYNKELYSLDFIHEE